MGCCGSGVWDLQGPLNYPGYERETQMKLEQIEKDLNICMPMHLTQSEVTDPFDPILQREERLLLIMSGVRRFSKSLP